MALSDKAFLKGAKAVRQVVDNFHGVQATGYRRIKGTDILAVPFGMAFDSVTDAMISKMKVAGQKHGIMVDACRATHGTDYVRVDTTASNELAAKEKAMDVPDFVTSQKKLVSMLKRAMSNMKTANPSQGGVRKHGSGNKAHQGKLFGFHKRASEAKEMKDIDAIYSELKSAKQSRAKIKKTTSVKANADAVARLKATAGLYYTKRDVYRSPRRGGSTGYSKSAQKNYHVVKKLELEVTDHATNKKTLVIPADTYVVITTVDTGHIRLHFWDPHESDPIFKYYLTLTQAELIRKNSD